MIVIGSLSWWLYVRSQKRTYKYIQRNFLQFDLKNSGIVLVILLILHIMAKEVDVLVTKKDLKDLVDRARCTFYRAAVYRKEDEDIYKNSLKLFKKDYECQLVVNNGMFTAHYPARIIIPVKDKSASSGESCKFDVTKFQRMMSDTCRVRRRHRFPVPALLFEGNFICRSSSMFESMAIRWIEREKHKTSFQEENFEYEMNIHTAVFILLNLNYLEELKEDVALLQYLDVRYIYDLRVKSMKNKYSEIVNSSAEACTQLYKNFNTVFVPYPGIEYFIAYHYNPDPEQLRYDWTQKKVGVELQLPTTDVVPPSINFSKYKEWSVLELTQNYLQLLLAYVTSKQGVLVHCVIGCDRTPFFISLLRLSLWADGLIHASLSPVEMAYLTIGYDWYLFGHDLPKRIQEKCEMMHFGFNILDYFTSDQFMARKPDGKPAEKKDQKIPSANDRKQKLETVRKLFLEAYGEMVKATDEPPKEKPPEEGLDK